MWYGEASLSPAITSAIDPRAMLTMYFLKTAWGTRDGADDDDAYRMIRVHRKHPEAGSLVANEACLHEGEKSEYVYRA